jgi:RNA polymerase sigma-70 factor (ECF subfamily)
MNDSRQHKFHALVEGHAGDLYRYACWLSKDSDLAHDLVQETCLRAWKSLDRLRDAGAAKSWLFTILRREFHRVLQRRPPPAAELDESLHCPAPTSYDTRTEAFQLRRALAELSDDYREPLVLQVIGGFSCNEIAVMMDLSPAAVMTRLFRARKSLRAVLGDESERDAVDKKVSP